MHTAIYPGSFDPVTRGHLDIIARAARATDKLIVAVLNNGAKNSLFSVEERVKMLKEELEEIPNIEVRSFNGLLVEFAKQCDAHIVVRGLRAITDFEYELQMAQTNRILDHSIDTFFLTADLEYAYLSSSTVKEVARFGGDISAFVTPAVAERVMEKYTGVSK
ncbi:MAG: pantetheine-phosphate adenylyltransferase [Lachnospiraceae bacterium]|nr:pantetheine-phosphate adenylyltransferase [Lachnospiraceae bacterium]